MNKEIEKFLIQMGVGISNKYNYFKRNPNYKTEDYNEEFKIGRKSIKLNNKIYNVSELEDVIYSGFDSYKNNLSKINLESNYDSAIDETTKFLTDFIKMSNSFNMDDNIELIEQLILTTLNNINNNSYKLFDKYNKNVDKIDLESKYELDEKQNAILNDNSNMVFHTTTNTYNTLFGKRADIFISATPLGGNGTISRGDELKITSKLVEEKKFEKLLNAKNELTKELFKSFSSTISKFISQFVELVITKKQDLFTTTNFSSDDVEICPYFAHNYISVCENIEKEDYDNLIKALDYYEVKDMFADILKKAIVDKSFVSIVDDGTKYNGNLLKLFNDKFGGKNLDSEISNSVISYFEDSFKQNLGVEPDEYSVAEAKKDFEIISKNPGNILSSEELSKLTNKYNSLLKEYNDNDKELKKIIKKHKHPKLKKFLIIGSIITIITLAVGIFYDTTTASELLAVILVGLLALAVHKKVKKIKKDFRGY